MSKMRAKFQDASVAAGRSCGRRSLIVRQGSVLTASIVGLAETLDLVVDEADRLGTPPHEAFEVAAINLLPLEIEYLAQGGGLKSVGGEHIGASNAAFGPHALTAAVRNERVLSQIGLACNGVWRSNSRVDAV